MEITITLPSNNYKAPVKRLGLFDLDQVRDSVDIPDRDIYYEVKSLAGIEKVKYNLDMAIAKNRIPEMPEGYDPDNPPPERTKQWHKWRTYDLYKRGIAQRALHNEALEQVFDAIARHIIEHCVKSEDRAHIQTADDFEAIYKAVVPPRINVDDLRKAADILHMSYGEQNIVDAVMNGEKSNAQGDLGMIMLNRLMNQAGFMQDHLFEMSVIEIAARIVSENWSEWTSSLAWQESKAGMKA